MKTIKLPNPIKNQRLYKKRCRSLPKGLKYLFIRADDNFVYFEKRKRKVKKMILPVDDTHFPREHDRYQFATFLLSTIYLKNTRTAVDVGAHVGFMSRAMSEIFQKTISIEPDEKNYKCLTINCPKVSAINKAVGTGKEIGHIVSHVGNTGLNFFQEEENGFQTDKLDDLLSNTNNIDLIKFDIQGFEYKALLGAANTIKKWMPILIVEVSMGNGIYHDREEIRELLFGLGYIEEIKFGKDCIYVPKKNH